MMRAGSPIGQRGAELWPDIIDIAGLSACKKPPKLNFTSSVRGDGIFESSLVCGEGACTITGKHPCRNEHHKQTNDAGSRHQNANQDEGTGSRMGGNGKRWRQDEA